VAREVAEDFLGYVLREMRVTANPPQRHGINEWQMALYELGEGSFGLVIDVRAEKSGVVVHGGYA
jgi:hypothetical protein